MQRLRVILLLPALLWLGLAGNVRADSTSNEITGHIIKVLPLLLDTNNLVAPSPSLFDRDAYQANLLRHTNEISGLRFDICWKARHASGMKLILRLELRGIGAGGLPSQKVLEENVTPKILNHWSSLTLAGPDYKNFGVLAAWRASLWNGGQLLGQQESFLWSTP